MEEQPPGSSTTCCRRPSTASPSRRSTTRDPLSRCWGRPSPVKSGNLFSARMQLASYKSERLTSPHLPPPPCRCGPCAQESPVLRHHPDQFCSNLGTRRPRRGAVSHRLDQKGRGRLPICKLDADHVQDFLAHDLLRRETPGPGRSRSSPRAAAENIAKTDTFCFNPTVIALIRPLFLLGGENVPWCQVAFNTPCFCFPHQAILNNDETTYLLENLEPDTPYDVSVTAIYPDESESEDLLGTERTRKAHDSDGPTVTTSEGRRCFDFQSPFPPDGWRRSDNNLFTDRPEMCSQGRLSSSVRLFMPHNTSMFALFSVQERWYCM